MSTLFISHSSSDNDAAKELSRRLAEPPRNHHSVFLDLDPEQGIVAGQSWERTLYRKLRSCRAVIALITDSYLGSQWCFAEIALARMEGKHIFALLADPLGDGVKLPAILTEKQFIDLRQDPEDGYRRLWKGLEELDLLGVAGEWDPKQSPYLGLRAYQEKHAAVFFGRGAETRAGIELLDRGAPGLIMVLGSSGSGKSSLVRAGMVPRLRRDADRWLVADPFRPQRDPVAELSESLAAAYRRFAPDEAVRQGSKERIREKLEAGLPRAPVEEARAEAEAAGAAETAQAPSVADERLQNLLSQLEELRRTPPDGAGPPVMKFLDWSLDDLRRICGAEPPAPAGAAPASGASPLVEIADHLRRASGRENARLLLVVDQFEELLGRDEPGDRPHRFLKMLRDAVEVEHSPLMVLGTMRSDFLGLFQRSRALRDVDFESLSVGPMSVDAMRRVIEEPAKLGALELEPGLADRLLADTETPDALPLLSFTLWRLWEDRQDGRLSVAQYEALGGLHGAVAREAEAVLESARKQGQEEDVRAAFLQMARLTEDGSYARQPASWDREELQKVKPILQAFEQRRLLVTRQEEGASSATLEVAHEALFRSWEPLKSWLDENRSELLLKQQLRRDARVWDEGERAADTLWRGGRLHQAIELMEKGELEEAEEATSVDVLFVRAGLRRRLIRRWTGIGIAALFFLGLGAGLFVALMAMEEAQKQAGIAKAGSAAYGSVRSRTNRPDLASLLALEALNEMEALNGADTSDVVINLFEMSQSHPHLETVLHCQGEISSVAFGPEGILAAGNDGGEVQLWRLEKSGAKPLGGPQRVSGGRVSSIAFGSDGVLASIGLRDEEDPSGGDVLRLWRFEESGVKPIGDPLESEEYLVPLGEPLEGHEHIVLSFALGPDRTLVTVGVDEAEDDRATLRLWKLDQPVARPVGEPHEVDETGITFGRDGTLATQREDGKLQLWRLGESGVEPFPERLEVVDQGDVQRLEEEIAAAGEGNQQVEDTQQEKQLKSKLAALSHVIFGPDGTFATNRADGALKVWKVDRSGTTPQHELEGYGANANAIARGPEGALATSYGQSVRLWRFGVPGETVLSKRLRVHEVESVTRIAFGPEGIFAGGSEAGGEYFPWPFYLWLSHWELEESVWKPGRLVEDEGFGLDGEDVMGDISAFFAWGPDGLVVAGNPDFKKLSLWRFGEKGAIGLGEFPEGSRNVSAAVFGADRRLALGGEDGKVQLWRLRESVAGDATTRAVESDAGTGSAPREFPGTPLGASVSGHEAAVTVLSFGPDQTLATGDMNGTVQIWKYDDSGARQLEMPERDEKTHESEVSEFAFSKDGGYLASRDFSGTVQLWKYDGSGARQLDRPERHENEVAGFAFSPDGGYLALRDSAGMVQLWRVEESGATRIGDDSKVGATRLAFGPDGTLATGDVYGDVRLWRVDQDGATPLGDPMTGGGGMVESLAFGPYGLASGHQDGVVWLRQLGVESMRALGCRRASRNLSLEEWRKHMGRDQPYRCTCSELPPGDKVEVGHLAEDSGCAGY